MHKIIHHSLAYLLSRGIPAAINVLALAIYTRFLTPEEYGRYAIALTVVVFFYSTLFQWIGMSLSRFFPSFHDDKSFLKNILISFFCLLTFTCLISGVMMLFLKDQNSQVLLAICTVFLWGYSWFELTLEFVRCRFLPIRYGVISIAKAVFALLLSFLFIFYGMGAVGIILGNIFAISLVTLPFFKREWGNALHHKINFNFMKDFLHYGLPLIPTTSLTVVVMSADRLLLGWFMGAREAGLYATSYDLTAPTLYILLMAIFIATYPFITRALENDGVYQARVALTHYLHLLLAVSIPACVGFALLAPNISHVVLGKEFWTTATELIPWISMIAFLTGIRTYYFDLSFQLGKNTKKLIWVSVVVATISIGLNCVLIPYFGHMAVIYTGLVTTTLGCVASWFIGQSVFPLPVFSWEVVKIFSASCGMSIVLWPMRHWIGIEFLLLQILVGVLSYAFLGFLFNIADCRKKMFDIINLRLASN
jgi:O-antigen/teichoic acid export membrane protein